MREGDTAMLTKPLYGRQFFEADTGDGGGGGDGKPATQNDGDESQNAKPGGEQGDGGFKPINSEAELSAWKSSTRKAIADDVRKELAEEQRKRDEDARAKAEQDEAVKRGEFEKVKTDLEAERDEAKTEADTLKARVEQYETLAAKRVDALKDELKLPDEVMKRFPDDADSLVKLTWLEEQGELAKLYRTEGGGPRDGVKLPKTPDANGTVRELTKDEQAAYDRQFVRSF
jgi:hypothetical protein